MGAFSTLCTVLHYSLLSVFITNAGAVETIHSVIYDLADETPAAALIGNLADSLAAQKLSSDISFVLMTSNKFQYLSDFFRLSSNGDLVTLRPIDRDNTNEICGPLACCQLVVCQIEANVIATREHKKTGQLVKGTPVEHNEHYSSRSSSDQISISLLIRINDANDNAPRFLPARIDEDVGMIGSSTHYFNIYVREGETSKPEPLPVAVDADSQANGIIEYRFQQLTANGLPDQDPKFELNTLNSANKHAQDRLPVEVDMPKTTTPELVQIRQLDYENESERQIKAVLTAIDGGQPALTGTLSLVINLLDINDNSPRFIHSQAESPILIPENSTFQDKPIYTVKAVDADSGENGQVTYAFSPLASADVISKFSIEPSTGAIRVKYPLDYEVYSERQFVLPIVARDSGSPHFSTTTSVFIKLQDINDNAPTLVVQENNTIPEGEYLTKPVIKFYIKDEDEVSHGKVKCQLANLTADYLLDSDLIAGEKFLRLHAVSDTVFFVFVKTILDYETTPRASLLIDCTDSAEMSSDAKYGVIKPLTYRIEVTAAVKDRNDNAPHFEKTEYNAKFEEHAPEGTVVAQVHAVDADSGEFGHLVYLLGTVSSDPLKATLSNQIQRTFIVDPSNGQIKVAQPSLLDRELVDTFHVQIIAKDKGGLSASVTVNFQLTDINDCPPTLAGLSEFTLEENQRVDTVIGRIHYIDRDQGKNAKIHLLPWTHTGTEVDKYIRLTMDTNFRYATPSNGSDIRTRANELIGEGEVRALLVSQMPVDRESYATIFFQVLAFDEGEPSNTVTTTFTIQITDQNDNAPVPIFPLLDTTVGYNPPIYENSPYGSHVTQLRASDPDQGENGTVLYKLREGTNGSEIFQLNETTGELLTAWIPRKHEKPKDASLKQSEQKSAKIEKNKRKLSESGLPRQPSSGVYLLEIILTDGGRQANRRENRFFVYVGPENPNLPQTKTHVNSEYSQTEIEGYHIEPSGRLIVMMLVVLGILLLASVITAVFWVTLHRRSKKPGNMNENPTAKTHYNPMVTKYEPSSFADLTFVGYANEQQTDSCHSETGHPAPIVVGSYVRPNSQSYSPTLCRTQMHEPLNSLSSFTFTLPTISTHSSQRPPLFDQFNTYSRASPITFSYSESPYIDREKVGSPNGHLFGLRTLPSYSNNNMNEKSGISSGTSPPATVSSANHFMDHPYGTTRESSVPEHSLVGAHDHTVYPSYDPMPFKTQTYEPPSYCYQTHSMHLDEGQKNG
ncbi:unnamed protein product [Calicophoron daubneyi]|uniref:Cadherin domain-containing protein n=1 Tax=Calicophoron daubneyi TaxID=300641 RepID=A0AAV2T9U9_CALDB